MQENRRDDILRKVQALLAKAMSTTFEAEADLFRAKANELMDAFRIEQWELAQAEQGRSKLSSLEPVRKDIDITWWYENEGTYASSLWTIMSECARLCAVVLASGAVDSQKRTMGAFGLYSDITFMEMLFTDLFIQMAAKVKPVYDPNSSIGENVFNAKEAGMKYEQIAHWTGHPEWITYKNGKKQLAGIMIREMKKYAAENGLTVHKEVSLGSYAEDFMRAYATSVTSKMREMRDAPTAETGSMALAIRDITDLAKELMYMEFPNLRPHPVGCTCDRCNPKMSTKPIKYRKSDYRSINTTATARGAQAGAQARIMGKNEAVKGRNESKRLDK